MCGQKSPAGYYNALEHCIFQQYDEQLHARIIYLFIHLFIYWCSLTVFFQTNQRFSVSLAILRWTNGVVLIAVAASCIVYKHRLCWWLCECHLLDVRRPVYSSTVVSSFVVDSQSNNVSTFAFGLSTCWCLVECYCFMCYTCEFLCVQSVVSHLSCLV